MSKRMFNSTQRKILRVIDCVFKEFLLKELDGTARRGLAGTKRFRVLHQARATAVRPD